MAKRDLPEEHLAMLRDGKDARNELVHRLIATRCVISKADKELFLAEIDTLYFRVWRAYRFIRDLKKQCAAKIGVTNERVNEIVRRKREEAQMEEDNLKNLLGEDPDRPRA